MQATIPRRSSTLVSPPPISLIGYTADLYSDSRKHGYQGPLRNVRLHRATTGGGGTIAKSEDGLRCVVAGRESLRILRLSDPEDPVNNDHKASIGRGGHRIEASRNIWDGSGLKIDSASTDVVWCHGSYDNKILTSARNGDLIMWDLNKGGNAKYERKTKNHIRSIHKLSCSSIVPYYCVTGSADGDMRVWDLRDMSKSLMKIHHPISVRSLVFSPCPSHPLQAVVGLDNGSIYRWDLQMGQRGQLDRLPVAHAGPILTLDWCSIPATNNSSDAVSTDRSWIVSGGLDHTVKVWDLNTSGTSVHIAHQPTYTLHPSFSVRRVLWRPEFPSEIAVVSNEDFGGGSGTDLLTSPRLQSATPAFLNTSGSVTDSTKVRDPKGNKALGDAVEIWDVRRGWIAKWTVEASASEGGVTDATFRDSHALWVQHASGTFAQVDLRRSVRPIDAVPRVALSWNVGVDGDTDGTLAFVSDRRARWEVPYDDIHPDKRHILPERKLKFKCLGDKSRMPVLQNMGTYVRRIQNVESGRLFEHLARKYIVFVESDGSNSNNDRAAVCKVNAEASSQAGSMSAAQVWMLLGSLLMDVVPKFMSMKPSSPLEKPQVIPLIHSNSAPAAIPTVGAGADSPSKLTSHRVVSSDSQDKTIHNPQTRHSSTSPSPALPRTANHPHPTGQRSTSNNSSGSQSREHDREHAKTNFKEQETKPRPPPNSRTLTPVSSRSSSPLHVPISLPPTPTPALPPYTMMTPAMITMRPGRPSVGNALQGHGHQRHPSTYNRPSASHSESTSTSASISASEKSKSQSLNLSLRHVGEGALDDSDSSDGGDNENSNSNSDVRDSHNHSHDYSHSENEEVEAGVPQRPNIMSNRSVSTGRTGPVNPSPLSRLAGQRSTEDEDDCGGKGHGDHDEADKREEEHEDDEASPSPGSTDTDGGYSGRESECSIRVRRQKEKEKVRVKAASVTRTRSRRNSLVVTKRVKLRSRVRGATVAALAAPSPLPTPLTLPSPLALASPPPVPDAESLGQGPHQLVKQESQSSVRTLTAGSVREYGPGKHHAAHTDAESQAELDTHSAWHDMTESRRRAVIEEEDHLREVVWCALREAVEEFAEAGDVQMCATLALVAPHELGIGRRRGVQFLEAYIERLMRLRLHSCAAYMRKYSGFEDVNNVTRLETVIYTACGRCRKQVVFSRSTAIGAHALCATCKSAVVKCSICHLPVRTLLFQCSVCTHGGHQECYRRYYMERPMVDVPAFSSSRGRSLIREREDVGEQGDIQTNTKERERERMLAGHLCAAGCGHCCWVGVGGH